MFASNVPEKIIGCISGHRSVVITQVSSKGLFISTCENLRHFLELYLAWSFIHSKRPYSTMLFGNLANCTVSIAPLNFIMNINPGPFCTAQSITDVEAEFDSLVKDIDYPTQ